MIELTRKQKKALNDYMPRIYKHAKAVAAERGLPITEVMGCLCLRPLQEPHASVILLKDAPEALDNPELQQSLVDRIRQTGSPHMPVIVRVIDAAGNEKKAVAFLDPTTKGPVL